MKKLLAILLLTAFTVQAHAGWDPKNPSKKFLKDYDNAKREFNMKTNKRTKVIDFYADLKLGFLNTNANVSSQNSVGSYNTESKTGFDSGILVYLNLFDALAFSTGVGFSAKGFTVDPPSFGVNNPLATGIDTNATEIQNNIINIPLNFDFGGMITDKFGLRFNGGPYFGIRISDTDNSGLGMKNFDLGLAGTLTGNYVIAPLVSVILGTKFEYGGLNNLGSTQTVESVRTTSWGLFTGLRFGFN